MDSNEASSDAREEFSVRIALLHTTHGATEILLPLVGTGFGVRAESLACGRIGLTHKGLENA